MKERRMKKRYIHAPMRRTLNKDKNSGSEDLGDEDGHDVYSFNDEDGRRF